MTELRIWEFADGTIVREEEFDGDLTEFVVEKDGKSVTINPDTIADRDDCARLMDEGENPLTSGWEDGAGNDLAAVFDSMKTVEDVIRILTSNEDMLIGGYSTPDGDVYQYSTLPNSSEWEIFTTLVKEDDYATCEEIEESAYAVHRVKTGTTYYREDNEIVEGFHYEG